MNTVKVKDVVLGQGAPKICVPMVGETFIQLKEEAAFLQNLDVDMVEWRVDFFEHVEEIEKVKETAMAIREILANKPLLFTFRSKKEGGERELSPAYYVALNQAIAQTGAVDAVDVELFTGDEYVRDVIKVAHENDVRVVISSHDFDKTPAKEEIISRLRKMQELGGDLPKIAVMPNSPADVLTLLDATNTMKEQYADRPIITMSMAGKGVISRLAGEIFGSALTFGAAKKASAPGQVNIAELRNVLTLLHDNLS